MTEDRLASAEKHPLRTRLLQALGEQPALAASFYARLFELQPGVRTLFPDDLASQELKFRQTLQTVLTLVDEAILLGLPPDEERSVGGGQSELQAQLVQLGRRHHGYGARPIHYAAVGEALMHALEQGTLTPMDSEQRAAWSRLYAWITVHMLEGWS